MAVDETARQLTFAAVVPTCDRPAVLFRALASILDQSRPADEIVVVDNGSVPVDEALLPPGVILVRAPRRGGAAQSRNIGAVRAESTWVAFLDDDGAWSPRCLEEIERAVKRSCALSPDPESKFLLGARKVDRSRARTSTRGRSDRLDPTQPR